MFAMKFRRAEREAPQPAPTEGFSLVTTLRAAGTSATVLVHNLSSTGFEAECVTRLKAGARVRINLPGLGDVDARITASRRGTLAGAFLRPIDLAQCVAAANWPGIDFNEVAPAPPVKLELI